MVPTDWSEVPGPTKQSEDAQKLDTDRDRHPDFVKAMRTIIQEAEIPDGPVERIEAFFHADGSATYRVWTPRAEESEGGFIGPDALR